MMGLLYGRNIKLIVYTPLKKVVIENLYVSFDILLRRSEKPNTAKIQVYNLAESTRSVLQGDWLLCEFYASYGSDEPVMIFQGQIANIIHMQNNVDWITEIYAGDGQETFEKTKIGKTYSAGTTLQTIVEDIANAMGVSLNIGVAGLDGLDFVYMNRPRTIEGLAKNVLTTLLADYNYKWSLQFGTIEIMLESQPPITETTIVNLNSETGLLGTPSINWVKKKLKNGKIEFTSNVQCEVLMIPEIKPNRLLKIDAEQFKVNYGSLSVDKIDESNASGIYLTDQIQFQGDNFGGAFGGKVKANGSV